MAERYEDNDLLTVQEAAAAAACHPTTIQRAYRAGVLRAYRARGSRMVRVRYADLRDWMMSEPAAREGVVADAKPVGAIIGSGTTGTAALTRRLEALRSSRQGRGARGHVRGGVSARRAEETAAPPLE